MSPKVSLLVLSGLAVTAVAGCRGERSERPPIHFNPNMDSQPRYDPQAMSKLFEDRRTMRTPDEHAVPRGQLNEDEAYAYGKEGDKWVMKAPVPMTEATLRRGEERYNIYCSPCHDMTGAGHGMVITRAAGAFPAPTDLHGDYAHKLTDGQIYNAIANGVRNMPSYGAQVPVADRWAIVAYVRALQLSQAAPIDDVPADKRAGLPEEKAQ
ncbi:MAG: cytochrome c [Polyangiaceae bacterium]|nr:cytochrome c [Polyangiaceae bacterium]